MKIDKEVAIATTALIAALTVLGIEATILSPPGYTGIAILNGECKLGYYYDTVPLNTPTRYCLYMSNGYSKPLLLQARIYVVETDKTGTLNEPLNRTPTLFITRILAPRSNITVPFNLTLEKTGEYVVIAQLYYLKDDTWQFTGKSVYIHVRGIPTG